MKKASAPQEHFIHPAYARLLYALVQEQGLDGDRLFAGAGLRWAHVATDPWNIKFATFCKVVQAAQDALQCPWLGLHMGSHGHVPVHGAVGNAAISSATLRQVLQTLARYGHLRCDALRCAYFESPAQGRLTMTVDVVAGHQVQFFYEAVFSTLMTVVETAVGNVLAGVQVDVPFAKPPWAERYQHYGLGRLNFGCDTLSLYFRPSDLSLSCITADANSHALAVRECERLLGLQRDCSCRQRVGQLLQPDGSAPFVFPSLSELAAQLHVSNRTLIRRLKAEGTSYQDMLDTVRKDDAAWQLRNTSDPIGQIAHRLGYRDASNFSRSFSRWFGLTPGEFRKRQAGLG